MNLPRVKRKSILLESAETWLEDFSIFTESLTRLPGQVWDRILIDLAHDTHK